MYHNSSQKKFWTYDKEETLDKLRLEANQKFCSKALSSGKVSHNVEFFVFFLQARLSIYLSIYIYTLQCTIKPVIYSVNSMHHNHIISSSVFQPGINESMLLDGWEEKVLFRHYEKRLLDFCAVFKPVMPKSVVVIIISFISVKGEII